MTRDTEEFATTVLLDQPREAVEDLLSLARECGRDLLIACLVDRSDGRGAARPPGISAGYAGYGPKKRTLSILAIWPRVALLPQRK